jgi:hypothetical protein
MFTLPILPCGMVAEGGATVFGGASDCGWAARAYSSKLVTSGTVSEIAADFLRKLLRFDLVFIKGCAPQLAPFEPKLTLNKIMSIVIEIKYTYYW